MKYDNVTRMVTGLAPSSAKTSHRPRELMQTEMAQLEVVTGERLEAVLRDHRDGRERRVEHGSSEGTPQP